MGIRFASLVVLVAVAFTVGAFAVVVERLAPAPQLAFGLIAIWGGLMLITPQKSVWSSFVALCLFASLFCFLFVKSGISPPLSSGNAGILLRLTQVFLGVGAISFAAFCLDRNRNLGLLGLFLFGWVIAYLSSDKGGADPMLRLFLDIGLSPANAETAVFLTRKTVHFVFYGLCAAAAHRVAGSIPVAAGFALSLASFDELRQASFGNRSGSWIDVLLDAAGIATALWIVSRVPRALKSQDCQ